MLEFNFAAARRQMVDQQVRAWDVLDPQVIAAMEQLPREQYAPNAYRNLAYSDSDIPIGHGELMLSPQLQGRMLQALQIHSGDQILEIGTGTGYLSACIATMGARLDSLEIHADLAEAAKQRLSEHGIQSVNVVVDDGHTLSHDGPLYDAIIVTGSLPREDPSFPSRLAPGGRLVWIIGESPLMHLQRMVRSGETQWRSESLFETQVPPLVGAAVGPAFKF